LSIYISLIGRFLEPICCLRLIDWYANAGGEENPEMVLGRSKILLCGLAIPNRSL